MRIDAFIYAWLCMTSNPRTLHKYTVVMSKHGFSVLKSDYVANTSLKRGHLCAPRGRTCVRAMCLGTIQAKRARKHVCENLWIRVREKRREHKCARENRVNNTSRQTIVKQCVWRDVFVTQISRTRRFCSLRCSRTHTLKYSRTSSHTCFARTDPRRTPREVLHGRVSRQHLAKLILRSELHRRYPEVASRAPLFWVSTRDLHDRFPCI